MAGSRQTRAQKRRLSKKHQIIHVPDTKADVTSSVASIESIVRANQALERENRSLRQLLQQTQTPSQTQPAKYACRAAACTKCFNHVEHLYRHIRNQSDIDYKALCTIIEETCCRICGEDLGLPRLLVNHERKGHGLCYKTRLDKIFQPPAPLSPPSSTYTGDDILSNRSVEGTQDIYLFVNRMKLLYTGTRSVGGAHS